MRAAVDRTRRGARDQASRRRQAVRVRRARIRPVGSIPRLAIVDLLLSFLAQEEWRWSFSHEFGMVRSFSQGGRIAVRFAGAIGRTVW